MHRALLLAALALLAPQAGTASNFTVDRFDDAVDDTPADGACVAPGGGCTLRAALMQANATTTLDTIELPLGTLRLTLLAGPDDASFGDLDVLQPVEISGEGMRETVVEAQTGDRVLELHAGAAEVVLLTLRGGVAAGGGGVLVQGPAKLTCTSCLIRDNRATAEGGGGARVLEGGELFLFSSLLASNESSAGPGGGLWSAGGTELQNSRVTRNRASSGGGAAIIGPGVLSLNRSAVDRNRAVTNGGGIDVLGGLFFAGSSTLSGNFAANFGGGVHVAATAGTTLSQATLAANTAGGDGGGLHVADGGTVLAYNTILADNLAPSGAAPDCSGVLDSQDGHNLLESTAGCTLTGTLTGNVLGEDPLLLPLANHGGDTPTHELVSPDSPAWNAATDAECARFDQRGYERPRGAHCDIGATELYGFVPVDLELDPAGNGVLEPGFDGAVMEPKMANLLGADASLDTFLFQFVGPAGGIYTRPDSQASYGPIPPGFVESCAGTGQGCFEIEVRVAPNRPVAHWDANAREGPSFALPLALWRIHIGESFSDTPTSQPAFRSIETLLHVEATAGCAPGRFCPNDPLSRRQLARLLERAHWGEYPPPFMATGAVFADVPLADPDAPWIERLAADGATSGCAPDPDGGGPLLPRYCPDHPVRRDQLARHLVRMRLGAAFLPPACPAPLFADVSTADPHCPWIRTAVLSGFLTACAADPDGGGPLLPRYCPANGATRATAAVALARTFSLELWTLGL